MIGFRSFRTRLTVFLLALLLPILAGIYYYVNQNNRQYTEQTINLYLQQGADIFDYARQEQSQALLAIMSSLTWDYGFRAAYGSQDPATLYDAALNVLSRSMGSVDILMVADLEGRVIIDTGLQGFEVLSGPWRKLIITADHAEEGRATDVLLVGEKELPYQVLAVPLYLPRQVAWIIGGFALDREFVERVKNTTSSEISLVHHRHPRLDIVASSLDKASQEMLQRALNVDMVNSLRPQRVSLGTEVYGTLSRQMSAGGAGDESLLMLIQRSYSENIENERRFQSLLVRFYLAVLVVSVAAVFLLARSFTQPLQRLAGAVKKIERGDYTERVNLKARDELGQLAASVNSMAAGLAEKEKVRDLLGKVVSRQIAEELLERPPTLTGEEKVVTVMFADIRGFTTYCEQRAPNEVLPMLNRFLSTISRIVDDNHGVVDKYNGDSVMALFSVPLTSSDDPRNAMKAALEIVRTMPELGRGEFGLEQGFDASVGIHTGLVVAGNLGSPDRLNYSVVGDSVNLAARLESLTRLYEVNNIVSGDSRDAAPDFVYRELDRVRVFGKVTAVVIYELVGLPEELNEQDMADIHRYEQALAHFRRQRWDEAEQAFRTMLVEGLYAGQCKLFLARIKSYRVNPPPEDWGGIHTFDRKP